MTCWSTLIYEDDRKVRKHLILSDDTKRIETSANYRE